MQDWIDRLADVPVLDLTFAGNSVLSWMIAVVIALISYTIFRLLIFLV